MGKKQIWYSVGDAGHESRHCIKIGATYDTLRPREQEKIAELCAADYHSEHDGWESNWPLEFRLYETEQGDDVATLVVDLEAEPVFYATHKQPNP